MAAASDKKVMLGFLVRWCEVALGHKPSAEEFAEWANDQGEQRRNSRLFGRAITVKEARTILHHPGREVKVNVRPAELVRKRSRPRRAEKRQA